MRINIDIDIKHELEKLAKRFIAAIPKILVIMLFTFILYGCIGAKPKTVIKIVKQPRNTLTVPERPVLPRVEMSRVNGVITLSDEAYKTLQIRDTLIKGYVEKLEIIILDENDYIKEYNSQIEKETSSK